MINDTLLNLCPEIYGFYRLGKTGKPVDTCNQDILRTPVFTSVQNRKSEFCAFILPDIHAKDIFPDISIPMAIYTACFTMRPSLLTWKWMVSRKNKMGYSQNQRKTTRWYMSLQYSSLSFFTS